jgi:hypothetical protein
MPRKVGRVYRAGENLALKGNDMGERTWVDLLAEWVS